LCRPCQFSAPSPLPFAIAGLCPLTALGVPSLAWVPVPVCGLQLPSHCSSCLCLQHAGMCGPHPSQQHAACAASGCCGCSARRWGTFALVRSIALGFPPIRCVHDPAECSCSQLSAAGVPVRLRLSWPRVCPCMRAQATRSNVCCLALLGRGGGHCKQVAMLRVRACACQALPADSAVCQQRMPEWQGQVPVPKPCCKLCATRKVCRAGALISGRNFDPPGWTCVQPRQLLYRTHHHQVLDLGAWQGPD
jgi:hypothetical protein